MRPFALSISFATCLASALAAVAWAEEPASLRQAAEKHKLHLGAASGTSHLDDKQYVEVLVRNFTQITPEWEMKWGPIHPKPDVWDFKRCDRLVEFAAENQLKIKGHCLLWHESLPDYVKDLPAEALRSAVGEHIRTVVGRYKGKVYFWDVVNEA